MLSRLTPKVSSWPILSQLSAIGGLAIHDWATFNSAPIHLGTLLALSVLLFSLALQVRLSSALFSALIFPALMLTELRIDGLRPASIEIPIFGILTSAAFFLMLIGFTSLKMDDEERQKETAELRTLPKGRGYWRHVGTTRMGFYVTRRETDFLNRVLNDDHYKLLLDIGAGGGRLEPYLLSFAEHVVATDIRLEDLRDVDANARLDRVLVDASPGLPFRDESVDVVVTIEVPVASEQEWFRSECNRILRPGGRVVVTMYNSASYKGWLTKARRLTTRQMPVWGEHYYVSSITRQRQQWLQDGFIAEGAAGFYWLPFSRDADGRVIPLAAAIERTLSFLLPLRWSPWAAYCFGKPDNRTMASAE